jgi:hypothetical protein
MPGGFSVSAEVFPAGQILFSDQPISLLHFGLKKTAFVKLISFAI